MHDPEGSSNLDAALGYGLLRLTLGTDFLFHSYQRWLDPAKFIEGIVRDFVHTPLPVWSVRAFAASTLGWEPFVGLLLVLGLWTRVGLVSGALLVVALVFGTALRGEYTVLSEQLIYALLLLDGTPLRLETAAVWRAEAMSPMLRLFLDHAITVARQPKQ